MELACPPPGAGFETAMAGSLSASLSASTQMTRHRQRNDVAAASTGTGPAHTIISLTIG